MMRKQLPTSLAAGLLLLPCIVALANGQDRWTPNTQWFKEARIYERPNGGYVRSKETAIAIGRAVMQDAYGIKFTKGLEPIDAKLFGDVWVVYSFFGQSGNLPSAGGVTTVEISKTSGTVLSMRSER